MRTTLTLDEDVAARLIELQKKRGQSFKDVVNQTLRRGLEQQGASRTTTPKFRVKARKLGVHPGLNYDNVGELLEQIEGAGRQ